MVCKLFYARMITVQLLSTIYWGFVESTFFNCNFFLFNFADEYLFYHPEGIRGLELFFQSFFNFIMILMFFFCSFTSF